MYLLASDFPFETPFGKIGLPWWIVVIVLGRELVMTIFRQAAARRGVVISAIGPAKVKTAFQLVWQGAAYFWFGVATFALVHGWSGTAWHGLAFFIGIAGTALMSVAGLLPPFSFLLVGSCSGPRFC